MLDASVERVNLALLLLDPTGVVLARSALAGELLSRDCGVIVGDDARLRIAATGAPVVDSRRVPGRRSIELPLRIERGEARAADVAAVASGRARGLDGGAVRS